MGVHMDRAPVTSRLYTTLLLIAKPARQRSGGSAAALGRTRANSAAERTLGSVSGRSAHDRSLTRCQAPFPAWHAQFHDAANMTAPQDSDRLFQVTPGLRTSPRALWWISGRGMDATCQGPRRGPAMHVWRRTGGGAGRLELRGPSGPSRKQVTWRAHLVLRECRVASPAHVPKRATASAGH